MTGDADFDATFRRHYPAVLRYAMRRSDPTTASDIAADVFLTAWRRRDVTREIELPWLLGVARRVLANHYRSTDRATALATRIRHEQSDNLDDVADQIAQREAWAEALGALSADDQELLTLIAWDGLTVGDAATVLGCAPATASMRLTRARRRLRRKLLDATLDTNDSLYTKPSLGGQDV